MTRRGLPWIVAVVALLGAALVLRGHGQARGRGRGPVTPAAPVLIPAPGAAPRQPGTRTSRTVGPRATLGARQDPQDSNPHLRAQMGGQALRLRPAFQHLPYIGEGIDVEFVGAAPDGRIRLRIVYEGPRRAAQAAYQRFLAYWRDSGQGYAVRYRAAAHGGP
jgi:hypothetical protein